jgi:hypothetical protein
LVVNEAIKCDNDIISEFAAYIKHFIL